MNFPSFCLQYYYNNVPRWIICLVPYNSQCVKKVLKRQFFINIWSIIHKYICKIHQKSKYLPNWNFIFISAWGMLVKVPRSFRCTFSNYDVPRISSHHWISVHKWFSEADTAQEHNEHFIFFYPLVTDHKDKTFWCRLF